MGISESAYELTEDQKLIHDDPEGDQGANTRDGAGFAGYWRIFHYADRLDWTLNGIALACSIASGAAMPLMTIIFGQFTTKFSNFAGASGDRDSFKDDVDHFVLWFIYLFVGKFLCTYIATMAISVAGIRTTRALRQAFLSHLLRTEIWYFDTARTGSPATQITTNATRVNQGIAEKLALLVQGLAMFFSAFIVALSAQWKLALIAMSVIPLMFLVFAVCMGFSAGIEANITRTYSDGAALAQEVLSSVRTIHAFWAQSRMTSNYDRYLTLAHNHGKRKTVATGVLASTTYFCVYSGNALAFWQGNRMFQNGEIETAGKVITVVLTILMASSAMGLVFPQLESITHAAAAASELFQIMDKPSDLDPLSEDGLRPDSCMGNIAFHDVNFSYPSRPTARILQGLNLSIPSGRSTALIGASGSGKSTVVGLLERWYKPLSGQITVDGIDIAHLNTKWLRNQIALVQQEPILFQGTVFENVAKGFVESQKILSHAEQLVLVQSACRDSYADEFIQGLPQGYDTYLGERGGTLSGGQRQRIAIARSIVSNPRILLLDEATSALDPRAEGIVQKALDRVSKSRTTLVIAHRLSTVKNADNIVVVSNGQVVEQGTHEELIARDGAYARLIRAQNLNTTHSEENMGKPEDDAKDGSDTILTKPTTNLPGNNNTADTASGKESNSRSLLSALLLITREQRQLYPFIALGILFSFVAAGTWPVQSFLFSKLIDLFAHAASASGESDFYALMFFVLALASLLSYFIIGFVANIISQTVTHRYRLELFERILSMDIEFFDRAQNTSGALASQLSTVPDNLQELISVNVFVMLIMVINLIASSCLALGYGWKLALVMVFGGLPPLIGSGYVRIRLELALNERNDLRFSQSASLAVEAVSSLRTVASLTLESDILQQYAAILHGITRQSILFLGVAMIPYAVSQSIEFLVMALGFWYGSRLMASGEYTTYQFFIIFMSVLFAGQAASQLFGAAGSMTRAKGAVDYLLSLRSQQSVIKETVDNRGEGPSGDHSISLSDVHFRYPGRAESVLKGISMTIPTGSFVACVGHSGSGKSTLISLLERYYDPTAGLIRLGNDDIKRFSPKLYRAHLSLVQQEPRLYPGSVKENILLGMESDASEDYLVGAAKQANLLDFIMSLPDGFETSCGSQGSSFSGGQKQRIAIARALIRNPRVLLLDEATSALDTESERLVQEALDRADQSSGRTTIAVAHRLSTIRNADIIFVFSNGKIVEAGNHEELQRRRGVYHELCMAQSLDKTV
ncbi:P-loop containing nucleoside triphosphate hydrolase protein [Aspergillus steynii IBT 23096]|uniref:P-loop containing nucleoside triphosphate hydrolase protein n=1 Tax=Aspergillus steynii IBT 23096 TaxID=1392250 RepID=A0A2I2GL06_9EURO|nr:P-loop containing nucleoside triphosphate hydrolase protein [Aspergillus steynii IBT 23096]PLB53566.1 P-loop containing nucleoside triphosphate hydrolase protein [Aspergillus steynii IBT 23096]